MNVYWPANQTAAASTNCTVTYPTTYTATYPWTYTYWPQATPQPVTLQPMANGWRCGDCQTVMAPWMQAHKCATTATTATTSIAPTTTTVTATPGIYAGGPSGYNATLNKDDADESENT